MMRSTTQTPSSTMQALLTRLRTSARKRGQNGNLLQCQHSQRSGDRSHTSARTYPEPSSPCPSILPKSLDGVIVLHDCVEATVDICFVHGLAGDRNSAWTAEGQWQPWPASLLPSKLSRARILTYGYDAYILRKSVASTNGLIEHATTLLNDLTTERASSGATSRPIIFVAHCLGGLVCKEAILLSRNHPEPRLREIFLSIKGLAFMGTPHNGLDDWAKIRAADLGVLKSTNRSLLEILETDDEYLQSVQDRFWSLIQEKPTDGHGLEIACFFEELALPGVGEVVPKNSATLGNRNAIGIHANHCDMARFSSGDDNGFKRLLGKLIGWEAQIKGVVANQSEHLSRETDISEVAEPHEITEPPKAAGPHEAAEPHQVVEPNYTYKPGLEAAASTSRTVRDLSPHSGTQSPGATLHHKGSFRSWLRHKKDEAIEFAHEKKEEAIQFAHENGLDM